MEGTPVWLQVVQAVTSLATLVTLTLFLIQVRIMRRQVTLADAQLQASIQQFREQQAYNEARFTDLQNSDRSKNVFALSQVLETPENLASRRLAGQLPAEIDQWSEADRQAADATARLWNMAVMYDELKVLPQGYLMIFYGDAILRSWTILRPYVEELRQRTDATQRIQFEGFANRVAQLRNLNIAPYYYGQLSKEFLRDLGHDKPLGPGMP